jgi:hypothetical protein
MTSQNFRALILATCILSATPAASHAADFSFDIESGAVWNGYNDVRIPNDRLGTPFSLTDDLSADEPSAYFRARATWHLNEKHDISILAAPLRMDYSGEFDQPVRFDGTTFLEGKATSAKYRFDSYRLTWRYNFIRTENFTFGAGITGKIRDAEIELSQAGRSASDSNTGFIPLINFRLAWEFAPRWSLLAEGDWLIGPQGRAEDVLAAVQWQATDAMALHLGYRILEGGADNDDVYSFSLFHYLAAGVTFRF